MQLFMSLYRHDRLRSGKYATVNTDESLTQQSDAKETDINFIVAQYHKTGQMPQLTAQALYGNFDDGLDYRQALDRINEAKEAFQEIPADIRKRFNNDPAEFLEFAQNPENIDDLRKMGLANPLPPRINSDAPTTEYYDDGERTRTTDNAPARRSARGTGPEPREGEDPIRQRQELREDGDREPRRSGSSSRSSQGPYRGPPADTGPLIGPGR